MPDSQPLGQFADWSVEEIRQQITYLTAALTPGTNVNRNTTFYAGKGATMRRELDELRAELETRTSKNESEFPRGFPEEGEIQWDR